MDLNVDGKVALVTGASQGIGLTTAQRLLAEGMHVLGTSRSEPPDIGMAHLALDMADPLAGQQAVEACVERFGRLDVVVNNVGGARMSKGFADETDEAWSTYWQLNFMSAVRTSRHALPHLADTRGVIVNVSSINASLPDPSIFAYNASKAAMDTVTVALAQEYGPRGVRVVGVAPGPVSTPMWLGPTGAAAQAAALGAGDAADIVAGTERAIPIGRFSTPEEIADAIAFLASPLAGSITGTTLRIDGGLNPSR